MQHSQGTQKLYRGQDYLEAGLRLLSLKNTLGAHFRDENQVTERAEGENGQSRELIQYSQFSPSQHLLLLLLLLLPPKAIGQTPLLRLLLLCNLISFPTKLCFLMPHLSYGKRRRKQDSSDCDLRQSCWMTVEMQFGAQVLPKVNTVVHRKKN